MVKSICPSLISLERALCCENIKTICRLYISYKCTILLMFYMDMEKSILSLNGIIYQWSYFTKPHFVFIAKAVCSIITWEKSFAIKYTIFTMYGSLKGKHTQSEKELMEAKQAAFSQILQCSIHFERPRDTTDVF